MLALAMSSVKRGSNTDALCLHKSICIADSFHRAKPVNRDEAKRNRGSTAESREEKKALCLHKSICIADSFHRAKPVNRDEAKRNRGSAAESRPSHSRFPKPTVSRYIKENHAMQNYSED